MIGVDYLIQCPYCRCASSVSLYVDRRREIRLDHDCPSCGHRGLSAWDVVVTCFEGMAAYHQADAELRRRMDLEPMYRTPAGFWYGLVTKRRLDVAPTPEEECDRFDPRFDHYYDPGWLEGGE